MSFMWSYWHSKNTVCVWHWKRQLLSGSICENQWKSARFQMLPFATSDTLVIFEYLRRVYVGNRMKNIVGEKMELLLANISCVLSHLWNKMVFFYMIMNKLYYVVGLVLLLLFTSIKEKMKDIFTISLLNRIFYIIWEEKIFQVTKKITSLLQKPKFL